MNLLTCPDCEGAGRVFAEPVTVPTFDAGPDEPCERCGGAGNLPIEPDDHGNDVVSFGDGTAAVHAAGQWWLVADGPREVIA